MPASPTPSATAVLVTPTATVTTLTGTGTSTPLSEGAEVAVDLDRDGRRIVITPPERVPAGVDEDFGRQVAEFIERYRPALEALAR